jgi:hypothetical protein
VPLSTHCAPHLHAQVGPALQSLRHVEYFHDHVRIENLLFEGALQPQAGALAPDSARPGFGLTLRRAEAQRYSVSAATRKA